MSTNFIYSVPTKIYFGDNQLHHLGDELKQYGKRVLLIYGGGTIKRNGLYDRIIAEIQKAGLELFEMPGVAPNPRHTTVNRGADICKKEKIDVAMVQIGNETNGAMAGEKIWMNIVYHLMANGSKAIREVYPKALIAVHFANPEKEGAYLDYAKKVQR